MRASNLRAPDWEAVGKEAADAYVVVKTADERWESTVVAGTCEPEWPEDEWSDLFVYDREQRVWASVFDHDHGETGDFLGATRDISICDALSNEDDFTLHAREHAIEGDDD